MNVHVVAVGPSRKQVVIEIPANEVGDAFAKALANYQKFARIPGFRPGKAPANLIKTRFQKEIAGDVKDFLVPQHYHAALKSEKIDVESVVNVEAAVPVDGQAYAFSVTVDVVPEFPLPDYKSIRVEPKTVEVSEASIDEVINNIVSRMATFEETPGRVAEKGDQVTVNYTGTLDGKLISELIKGNEVLARAESLPVVLDEERFFLPEFIEGLVGAKSGDRKTIEVSFDDSFIDKELAGKKALYAVEVISVQARKLPELTDDFVKGMGAESMDGLRDRIRKDLSLMKKSEERRRVEGEIATKLQEMTDMTLPQSQVQRHTANEVYDLVQHNTRQGVTREAIEEHREKIFSTASKNAEVRLKLRYILLKIAEAEGVSVSDADVEQHIRNLAMRSHKDPAKLKAEFKKDGVMDDVKSDLLVSKAMELLVERQMPSTVAA